MAGEDRATLKFELNHMLKMATVGTLQGLTLV